MLIRYNDATGKITGWNLDPKADETMAERSGETVENIEGLSPPAGDFSSYTYDPINQVITGIPGPIDATVEDRLLKLEADFNGLDFKISAIEATKT